MGKNKYKNEQLKFSNPIGNNIRNLRMGKNWTQEELTLKLQFEMRVTEDQRLSSLSISAYETGSRVPPLTTLIALANIFNVSVDYLLGRTTVKADDEESEPKAVRTPMPEYDIALRPQEYRLYSGQPVFVKGPDGLSINKWAILDYNSADNIYLVFPSGKVQLKKEFVLYRHRPLETLGIVSEKLVQLKISDLEKHEYFWVESTSADESVKTLYSGHYRHREDRKGLINIANGLTLPYTGINVSFIAFEMDSKETE